MKECVTLLFSCTMTWMDKFGVRVNKKSADPRCICGIRSLPVEYKTINYKAWMAHGVIYLSLQVEPEINSEAKSSLHCT